MIKHAFTSAVPSLGDPSLVDLNKWNANHLFVPFVVPLVNASVTWTNMPAAATEFTGLPRTKYDLTNADECRIVLDIGVVGAGTLTIQYSTDQATWVNLSPASPAISALNVLVSAWAAVPAGARADVFLRVLGTGGDGVFDPQFRLVQLQVR